MQNDCSLDDDDIALNDIDPDMTEIELQLISTASIYCLIKFHEQTIVLPCSSNTLAKTIIEETLEKLHLTQDNYELLALTDDDRIPIEKDISVEEIYQLFPSQPTTIPFEMTKKEQ